MYGFTLKNETYSPGGDGWEVDEAHDPNPIRHASWHRKIIYLPRTQSYAVIMMKTAHGGMRRRIACADIW